MPRPPAPLHLSRNVNIMADDGGMASTKVQDEYFFRVWYHSWYQNGCQYG